VRRTRKAALRATVRGLRKFAPTPIPVIVRRRDLSPGLYGNTTLIEQRGRDHHFCISLSSRLRGWFLVETLLHEWAHATSWYASLKEPNHGSSWGVAYARLYSEMFDEKVDLTDGSPRDKLPA